ncbi:MAG: hypothetical protein AB1938_28595 [Myxococcota bacterium]
MSPRRCSRWVGAVLLVACHAAAAPRDFAFTWTTHLLEAGRDDLEGWLSPRIARVDPGYSLVDMRFVWTHGLENHLESQLSLDTSFENDDRTHSVDARVTSLFRWAPWKADGPVGLGGLVRLSLGTNVLEVEGRFLADKLVGDVLFAANVSASHSIFWNARTGITTRLEESFSVAYVLAPFARLGLEFRVKSSFAYGDYQGTAFYVGPSLAFRFKPVWFTLGAVAQVAAHQAEADRGTSEPLTLRDDERFGLRITLGLPTD